MGAGLADGPHLDGPIEACRRERVGVLGVKNNLHDVVAVSLEHLRARPLLVPVPDLDEHVVGAAEKKRKRGVRGDAADVVGVRLERLHLVHSVVVVHANEHVVATRNKPTKEKGSVCVCVCVLCQSPSF